METIPGWLMETQDFASLLEAVVRRLIEGGGKDLLAEGLVVLEAV